MGGSDTHYTSGEPIRVGDRVEHGPWTGVVVFVLGTGDFAPGYDLQHWAYLGRGFMIEYDKAGLVFSDEADEEVLLARA